MIWLKGTYTRKWMITMLDKDHMIFASKNVYINILYKESHKNFAFFIYIYKQYDFCLLFYVQSSVFSLRSKTLSLSLSPEVCWAWRAELATAVHRVCKDPWTEVEPVLGPECCLCESCTCCRWWFPVPAAWPWWPPALCVSAPASVAPGSLAGHGRWN